MEFFFREFSKMEDDLSEVAAEVRASSSLVEAKKENLFFEEFPPEGMHHIVFFLPLSKPWFTGPDSARVLGPIISAKHL